ncbi:MAG: anhydro-N-acetylmuramic acid kinase [Legionellales bacterium RIFCSPHIGHO2_12_FULL_37_14]|nr:MAG: anhydro-N-acetylmuramic acid kinase [Legionellales bacterium RIFCSPHIGHO2_12_FULL_37_14]
MTLYIGLMSGTSMDGIDAALMDVQSHTLISHLTEPYSASLKASVESLIINKAVTIAQIFQTHQLLGEAFAEAANNLITKANIDKSLIQAIGSHGQTIVHAPKEDPPYTVQLACPYTIALRTGLPVVADFRTKDLLLKGQGAPLAPIYHQEVFKSLSKPLAVVNIGGVANISFLDKDNKVKGYDVGPGNCLLDAFAQKCLNLPYDENGAFAMQGEVIPHLLEALLDDPFFSLGAPKSLDKAYFSLAKLNHLLKDDFANENIQATLTAFTAHAICAAIKQENVKLDNLILCGGGAHNKFLLATIKSLLKDTKVMSSNEYNISCDYLEAMLCAWLAYMRMQNKPLNLAAITGGGSALVGVIYC